MLRVAELSDEFVKTMVEGKSCWWKWRGSWFKRWRSLLTGSHIHDLETAAAAVAADTTADRTNQHMTTNNLRGSIGSDQREQCLPTMTLTNRQRQKTLPTLLPIDWRQGTRRPAAATCHLLPVTLSPLVAVADMDQGICSCQTSLLNWSLHKYSL